RTVAEVTPVEEPRKVTIRGHLVGAERAAGARVVFHLPEVPADVERSLDELQVAPDGSFQVTLEVTSPAAPTTCGITVRREGFPDVEVSNLALAGDVAEAPPLALDASASEPSRSGQEVSELGRERRQKAIEKMQARRQQREQKRDKRRRH
ncbi:MAG: hypothetical protein AB1758_08155, partial [Candidatus Eremiobacterota bacterium]